MTLLCRAPGIAGSIVVVTLFVQFGAATAVAQTAPRAADPAAGSGAENPSAVLAVQVQELRQALETMQGQIADARRDADALRLRLQAMESQVAALTGTPTPPAAADPIARIDALSQEQDLLNAKIADHEQTKVASGSKYRVRLSGLVLFNVLGTRGSVDSLDLPLLAVRQPAGQTGGAFSASVRQSWLGLEVFGPRVGGATTVGDLSFDFFGGFPITAQGVTEPLVRLRTARMSLQWEHAALIAGQDTPFFSPRSPTSLASTAYPALSSAGNLWVWTPEIHIERRLPVSDTSAFSVQAGVLDPLTGELPAQEYSRVATAGERTGTPGGAVRAGFQRNLRAERTIDLGVSGYFGRQAWVPHDTTDSWALAADWDLPLTRVLAISGEAYRGEALAGFGGGASAAVVFDRSLDTLRRPFAVPSAGGWAQLKVTAAPRLEFNSAFGLDNPSRGRVLHAVPIAIVDPGTVSRNASAFVNAIYQARSNFLFSLEYRQLWTTGLDDFTRRARHVSFSTGIGF